MTIDERADRMAKLLERLPYQTSDGVGLDPALLEKSRIRIREAQAAAAGAVATLDSVLFEVATVWNLPCD